MNSDIFRMDDRVALVTGASSGIGRRCAQVLAANGARVYAAARRTAQLEELRDEITARGGQCTPLALDVTSAQSLGEALAELPDGRLDILVNNAGIGDAGPFEDIDETRWQAMLDTNLTGAWRVAREAARLMGASGGCMVCTASILGLRQASHQSHYAVAKAGLIQLVRSMALELAPQNIRVNALAPGYFLTEINDFFLESDAGAKFIQRRIPMQRYGTVDELDGAFLLLCSDASSFMTGSVITVDGGHMVNSL